jgi:glucuronokinase
MNLIRKRAYSRAGLVGNPSDGYHGKTIACIVRNFAAEVVLYEWDSLEIVLSSDDRARFTCIHDLVRDVKLHGYYGGIRLIKATIKRFVEYCQARPLPLHDRNFSVRYQTDIPRQVGMAGSSAIITATLRALMEFYGVAIPKEIQPSFILSVEQELGITAGLQDRVIQVYEGLVYMDFDKATERMIEGLPTYSYEPLDAALLPPVYLAYHANLSEPTEVFHNDIRGRFNRGELEVVKALQHCADLAAQGRAALLARRYDELGRLMNENFDTRRSIYHLPPWQVEMVEVARGCGASAQFSGSGGAIVGLYTDEAMFHRLRDRLGALHCRTIKPQVVA